LVFITLVPYYLLQSGIAAAQHQGDQEESIHFLWAFGALRTGEGGARLIPIDRDTVLRTGDQIKFFVKLERPGFIYLIYHSSQGELSVLFPYRFEQGALSGARYFIPQGAEWFQLDEHVGQETFYLLASSTRLRELEELINKYETADPAKKRALAKSIVEEIRTLIWKNRRFKTFAEKPVPIMGSLRGTEKLQTRGTPDVTSLAVDISGKKFYSRTFTIDHQ